MARPLRVEIPGGIYHVISRGHARQAIFLDDDDRAAFLATLERTSGRYGMRCQAYCLMDNHYHLVVVTPEANLSRSLRYLNGVYAQTFNRRHERAGYLFQGRFRAIPVELEPYLLELVRYVLRNPVRAGLCTHPGEWAWSSYRAMVGEAPSPTFLDADWLLGQFGTTPPRSYERAKAFLTETSLAEEQGGLEQGGLCPAVSGKPPGSRGGTWSPRERPSLTDLLEGDDDPDILSAYREWGYTLREIASYLGVHESTVSRKLPRGAPANSDFRSNPGSG